MPIIKPEPKLSRWTSWLKSSTTLFLGAACPSFVGLQHEIAPKIARKPLNTDPKLRPITEVVTAVAAG